jgi:nucleotide-binding universal stress UspA family protein
MATSVEETVMFKHILLPTDGSPLSESTIRRCLVFAREIGAKVSGVHVLPESHVFTYRDGYTESVGYTRDQYILDLREHAQHYLDKLAGAAEEVGVPCETFLLNSDHTYEAIISAAEEKGCDLITMATHGKRGLKGFLLGSETQKVLAHSRIPVLVYH